MAKRKSPDLNVPTIHGRGYNAGVAFGVAMLETMEADDDLADVCDIGHEGEPGDPSLRRPQVNIVARFLESLIANGDEQTTEGFCAVLSAHIGAAIGGTVLDADYIRRIMTRRMVFAGIIEKQEQRKRKVPAPREPHCG